MADDTQAAAPVTLDSIRQKYPQYKDVDDDTLARGLHQKFYSQMPFNDFASKVGYKAPVKADTAAPQTDSAGKQIGHALADTAGAVAHGVGTSLDIGHNMLSQVGIGQPREYNSPDSFATDFARPFQHAPDAPEAPDVKEQARRNLPKIGDTDIAKRITENPTMQAIGKNVIAPITDAAGAGAALAGAPGMLRAGLEGASDVLGGASKSQAARVASNPALVRARADGFKVTADDVRGRTNPANTSSPNADLPGPSRTTPDTQDVVNTHNQTHGTKIAAEEVKLHNTRAINPDEVEERKSQEGKVYGQVGDAIGNSRDATPVLDHDLSTSAAKNADPAIQAKIDKDVQFYRDSLKGKFNGPKAVQTVRSLRDSAQELKKSTVPGDQARGTTYQNMADAIEDEMMRQLPAGNVPGLPGGQDLRSMFPAARQQLAKLYDLSEVTSGGQVNAAKVLALREAGKPLTGALDAIANAADAAPQSMQGPRGSPQHITTAPTPGRGSMIDAWNLGKAAVHKIPGLNPASDAYQASRYGKVGGSAATPPASAAPKVSEVRPEVKLTPGGTSGPAPTRPAEPHAEREGAPAPFEGGEVGALQRQLPLTRRDVPGDVMAPAEWDRQALARVRSMTPPERAAAEGPPVYHDKLSTTVKSRKGRPLGQAFNRDRE